MSIPYIIFIVVSGVTVLLLLVLWLKVNAFISLIVTSVFVGIMAGMPLSAITTSIQNGMGGTLGFVATVVGLGAIFGQILESSGGAESLAHHLIKKFGQKKASWALMVTGFSGCCPYCSHTRNICLGEGYKKITFVFWYTIAGRPCRCS
jgi:Gnt-I system low-affinity gluconate transporter